jgi:hypothetical protein
MTSADFESIKNEFRLVMEYQEKPRKDV